MMSCSQKVPSSFAPNVISLSFAVVMYNALMLNVISCRLHSSLTPDLISYNVVISAREKGRL